ncbi:SIS domain-containing protein [Lactovum odontotermitis]
MKPTMMTYINEEAEYLTKMLNSYPDAIPDITGKEWLILATGSSINAAYSAKYYIEHLTEVKIDIEEPFKFQYYEKLRPSTDVIIGVSQSGESTSTIEAIKALKAERADIETCAVTGNAASELAEVVDRVIDIDAGEERVGYVTKGFSLTTFMLMLIGLKRAVKSGSLNSDQEEKELEQFRKAIAAIPGIIERTETFFEKWQNNFTKASRFTSLCCGSIVGTAMEMQTKFCETVRVPSQGMDIEAFMHGPYLEVNRNHQLFFIETNSPVNDRLVRLRDYEAQYVDNLYTVMLNSSAESEPDERVLALDLGFIDEYKAPLFTIIPFQILAHHIAEKLGRNLPQRIYTDFGVAMQSKTKPGNYA